MSTLLIVTIFLPLAGAAALLAFRPSPAVARSATLAVSLAALVGAGVLVYNFPKDASPNPDYAASDFAWIGPSAGETSEGELLEDSGAALGAFDFDIRFSVGLDGVSLWLFALSALLMLTSVLVSWTAIRDRVSMFYGMLLLLLFGCLGVFAARDLILFYVFFEFTLLPLFFLIGIWGSEQRRYAAIKFFLFTLAGSLLTFLGLLAIVFWGAGRVGSLAELSNLPPERISFSIQKITERLAAAPERAIASLDADGDGLLGFEEFSRGKRGAQRSEAMEEFQSMALLRLDQDRSGGLSREELTAGADESEAASLARAFDALSPTGDPISRDKFLEMDERQLIQGGVRLSAADLRGADMTFQLLVFAALLVGFAIKVPLVPLHTWLPLAHVQAPTAGSVFLAGLLLKIGVYGFLRFSLPMLPEATAIFAPWLLWASVIGILYGALVALAQSDMKRLIAYSSVSHMGFCVLGLFALTPLGLQGGALQMINHGISTGALFAIVGMLYERYHTREIASLGGLARKLPLLSLCMLVFTFSSIGLPGLNGFAGEFLLLIGMFQKAWTDAPGAFTLDYRLIAVLAVLGVVLGAWYMLWLIQRVFFGPLKEPEHHEDAGENSPDHAEAHRPVRDLSWREGLALAPLAALALWIGLWPQFFVSRMEPALRQVLNRAAGDPVSDSTSATAERRNAQGGGRLFAETIRFEERFEGNRD
jgi:NADH:ubiquinone oxidoreductase subunit 4 (subunit M)